MHRAVASKCCGCNIPAETANFICVTGGTGPSAADIGPKHGPSFFSTASAVRKNSKWVDKQHLRSNEAVKQQQWSHHTARLAAVQLNTSWEGKPEAELLDLLEGYIAQASTDKADLRERSHFQAKGRDRAGARMVVSSWGPRGGRGAKCGAAARRVRVTGGKGVYFACGEGAAGGVRS